MIGKHGPFQIIDSERCDLINAPLTPPRRRYSCSNYELCLNLGAALNWDSFTCRGCSGEIDQTLLWRARQERSKDKVLRKICEFPEPAMLTNTGTDDFIPKVVGKG